jgi:ferric-dicitrate binding protein FerR (iron transport regulator)
MRYKAEFILCVLVALMLFLPAGPGLAQTPVGQIADVSGSAHLSRGSSTLAVVTGMPVALRDRLTTDAGAHLAIVLADNSRLELSEQSVLVIDEQVIGPGGRQSTTIGLLGGRVDSLVTTALRGAAPTFQVQTPNAIAGVRGTQFSVAFAPQSPVCGNSPSSDVAVDVGLVQVAARAAPTATVQVEAGYETVVCGTRPPLPAGPLGIAGMGGVGVGPGGYPGAAPSVGGAPPPACPVCPACTVPR